jgi:phosphoglycerol transferase MdoB-like AlkP superfamily enzyme
LMAPQDHDYRAFITQLHERLQQAGSRAALIGGVKSGVYAAGVALLALVAIAITGLLARAVATGAFGGALFLVGFAALFAWQIGGFVRRNRPQAYTFDHLPEALLP